MDTMRLDLNLLLTLEDLLAEQNVTIYKSSANKAALDTFNMGKIPKEETIGIFKNKYLNDRIEQDHRSIKRRIRTMLEFKSFRWAQTVLAGIEIVLMLLEGHYIQPEGKSLSLTAMFYHLAD